MSSSIPVNEDLREDDLTGEETERDQTSPITSTGASHTATGKRKNKEAKSHKEYITRSTCRQHFTWHSIDGKVKAICIHCKKALAGDSANGTMGLNKYYKRCKLNPDNQEVETSIQLYCKGGIEGGSKELGPIWKFDQVWIRDGLSFMLLIEEMPFSFVESTGFKEFMKRACPQFVIPSRSTAARNYLKMCANEKMNLKTYFANTSRRVSITTDTWTSSTQKTCYMSFTGHFVDENWVLQKRILNFIECESHKGEDLSMAIEKCLGEWGIKNVFTISIDNAASNDKMLGYLRERLVSDGSTVLGGEYLQVRCVAHILNLIVKAGLKNGEPLIECIRKAVRFVKNSPARLARFRAFRDEEKIKSKKFLALDVATRWNSVYLMLDRAIIFQRVFHKYLLSDTTFRTSMGDDMPLRSDWQVAERLVKVLQNFYDLTMKVSGSHYVTSNNFLSGFSDVDDLLNEWMNSSNEDLKEMGTRMKKKFVKYWGDNHRMNTMLYVAVILDPHLKHHYVKFILQSMHGHENGEVITDDAVNLLRRMFVEYNVKFGEKFPTSSSVSVPGSDPSVSSCNNMTDSEKEINARRVEKERRFREVLAQMGNKVESELEKYLSEPVCEADKGVLSWWSDRMKVYPILSRIACDVYSIPITTVSSESCFSTAGRIINEYRSSLAPKTAEALICCQDWLRHRPVPVIFDSEDMDFIESLEEDAHSILEGNDSTILRG